MCGLMREMGWKGFVAVKDTDPVEIGKDGRCTCHAGSVCPLGKAGMQFRCTREELEGAGIPTEQSSTEQSSTEQSSAEQSSAE